MQYRPTKRGLTRSKRTLAIATAIIVGLSGLAFNLATATTSSAETVEQCVQRRIDNRSGGAFLNTSTSFRTECQKEIAAKQQEVKNRPPADFNNTTVDAGELQAGKTRTPSKTPPPPGNNNSGNTGGAKTPAPPAQTPPAAASPAQTPPAAAPAKPAPAPDPAAAAKAKLQQTLTQEQAQLDAACKKAQVANITEANWNAAKKEYDAAYAATTKTRADNNLPKPNGYCQQLVKFTGTSAAATTGNTGTQQSTTGGTATGSTATNSTGTTSSTGSTATNNTGTTSTGTTSSTGSTATAGSTETNTAVREKALKDLAAQQLILNESCQKAQAANITADAWGTLQKQYQDAYAAATKIMADGNLGKPHGYCQFLIRFENGKMVDTTKAGHGTKFATARLDAAKKDAIAFRDSGKTAPVTELNRDGSTKSGTGTNTNTNTSGTNTSGTGTNTNTSNDSKSTTIDSTKTGNNSSTGTITGNKTDTSGSVSSNPTEKTASHKVEGSQVVITGKGFVPGTQVQVTVKDSSGTVINVSIATVASDQTVKATTPAPAGATASSLEVKLDPVK